MNEIRISSPVFFRVDEKKRKRWLEVLQIARERKMIEEEIKGLENKTKEENDEVTILMMFLVALQQGAVSLQKCYYTTVDEEYALQNYKKERIFISGLTDYGELIFSIAPIKKWRKS